MNQKPIAVLGIYPTRASVEYAVEAFRDAGFQSCDISLLLPERMSAEDIFIEEATNAFEEDANGEAEVAAIDDPLGWLHQASKATIPGAGSFIVAGPVAETLEKAGLQRAGGGLSSALIRIGIPQGQTGEYAGRVMQGEILLSVQCDNAEEAERAKRLHSDVGGINIFMADQPKSDSSMSMRSMSHGA